MLTTRRSRWDGHPTHEPTTWGLGITTAMGETEPRTNYVRRGIGLGAGVAPIVLLAASLSYGTLGHDSLSLFGLVPELLALLVACLNVYLSIVRSRLYRWKQGSLDGYRHVSGFPVFGTALATVGALIGFGSVVCATIGLVAVSIDTGGSLWFLIFTWRDGSLWDAPSPRS